MRISTHHPLRLLALGLLASGLLAACSTNSSKHKTHVPLPAPDIKHPELKIDTVWSHHVGDGGDKFYPNLRIAVGEGSVYAASIDGTVVAYDATTGKTQWHKRLEEKNPFARRFEFWKRNKPVPMIAGPSVDGSLLLTGTVDGHVIALSRTDGSKRWEAASSSELIAPPIGSGDVVVANSVDGHVFGLSADNGTRLWNYDRSPPSLTLRGMSAPLIVGGRVYLGMDDGHLAALDLGSGQPAWDQSISQPQGRSELDRLTDIDADLVSGDEGIYVVSYGGDIALIDNGTGQPLWRRTVKSYTGMALSGQLLVVTDADGIVWCFNAATGALQWKQEKLQYRTLSPPAVIDGAAVVGDYKGYVYWMSLTDGHFMARHRLSGKGIIAPPVAANGLMYVMDRSGELAAYRGVMH